jgi:hypothetical protein
MGMRCRHDLGIRVTAQVAKLTSILLGFRELDCGRRRHASSAELRAGGLTPVKYISGPTHPRTEAARVPPLPEPGPGLSDFLDSDGRGAGCAEEEIAISLAPIRTYTDARARAPRASHVFAVCRGLLVVGLPWGCRGVGEGLAGWDAGGRSPRRRCVVPLINECPRARTT